MRLTWLMLIGKQWGVYRLMWNSVYRIRSFAELCDVHMLGSFGRVVVFGLARTKAGRQLEDGWQCCVPTHLCVWLYGSLAGVSTLS